MKLSAIRSLAAMPTAAPERVRVKLHSAGIHVNPKAVGDSEDLERILQLPRRPIPTDLERAELARKWTAALRRPNVACACRALGSPFCITELNGVQGWYLEEAATSVGVLGHVKVGGGKTGINCLVPMVASRTPSDRFLLLVPSSLKSDFDIAFQLWAQHFRVPNLAGGTGPYFPDRPVLVVNTYSTLQTPNSADLLNAIAPVAIILDEGQNLKDRKATRTGRFIRYFVSCAGCGRQQTGPEKCTCAEFRERDVRLYVHSGTLTTRGLEDFAHLAALALREGSPVPAHPSTAERWGEVLNPFPTNDEPGSLKRLCVEGETVHQGFRRRLWETPGTVATNDAQLITPLRLLSRTPSKLPTGVRDILQEVRRRDMRPDGEVFTEKLDTATCCRQVACGFYYRWKYPRGEPRELIKEWFEKRQAWNKALRDKLLKRRDGLDSPKLCTDAAERGDAGYNGALPVWYCSEWAPWKAIREQVQPEQEAVWIDTFLAEDAARWALEHTGIVWYLHGAFGRKVADLSGLPRFGAGAKARHALRLEKGDRSIVASIRAHGTGRNLQQFCLNLVSNLPSDGSAWEQLIGRTERTGQRRAVDVIVYQHTREHRDALDSAFEYARYMQSLTGPQLLLSAELDTEPITDLDSDS